MPVRADRRLEFMRSVGERKRDLAAKVLAKEKKRREIDALKKKIPVLKLVYQAGCWFWVDQNTGEPRAAQAPDENETSAVGVEARRAQARPSRCPAADRVKAPHVQPPLGFGIDSGDGESLDSVDRTGTGAQFYDSSEFNDFMNILDSDAVKRRQPVSLAGDVRGARPRRRRKQRVAPPASEVGRPELERAVARALASVGAVGTRLQAARGRAETSTATFSAL
ncbi:hypothetical protein JL720_17075 [Aureococcus anophagefferens]|nr:hypothetical protein JL720_17075 [Aureococcus anophagefferens]